MEEGTIKSCTGYGAVIEAAAGDEVSFGREAWAGEWSELVNGLPVEFERDGVYATHAVLVVPA